MFELSYKIPSYARDYEKDEDEIAMVEGDKGQLWREDYKTWRNSMKS